MKKKAIESILRDNTKQVSALMPYETVTSKAYASNLITVVQIEKAAAAIAKEIQKENKRKKMIPLTKLQAWFIEKAINLSAAVLPLEESVLDAEMFKKDYGVSKEDVERALEHLSDKLKTISSGV